MKKIKKITGMVLSAIIALQAFGFGGISAAAAASAHRHTYKTYASGIGDNKKHQLIRKCTSCGNVSSTSKFSHTRGSIIRYERLDATKHNAVYQCKTNKNRTTECGEQFRTALYHRWQTLSPQDRDVTYHTVTKQCKDCGETKSELKKHSYSKGVCKCGRQKSNGIAATAKSKTGYCSLLGRPLGDKWVYANCPKCGSTSWTKNGKDKKIGKVNAPWSGYTVIYHQYAKCNNCGKKYTNNCYTQHEQ